MPAAARAEPPCVGVDFSLPLPGATDVERRSVDVSSARFAGLWQEGRIGGAAYQIFSDRTGMIADQLGTPSWRIDIVCEAGEGTCLQQDIGAVPEGAHRLADGLALCLTGSPVAAADFAPIAPTAASGLPDEVVPRAGTLIFDSGAGLATAAALAAETDAAPDPAACSDEVPEAARDQARQLQTLLTQIGEDPGPIDGLPGDRTTSALVNALGPEAAELDTGPALDALRAARCDQ